MRETHTQRDEKPTSESTIPETTTYHIDYLGKVTSCFSSSKFLMTFRFVAQPKNFHLTAAYVYIDFISRLLPTYPECQRLFMLGFWFRSSLSKDPRESFVGQDSADDLSDTKALRRNTNVA